MRSKDITRLKMRLIHRLKYYSKSKIVLSIIVFIIVLQLLGLHSIFFERDFTSEFKYPYEGDFSLSAYQLRHGHKPNLLPMNEYKYDFIHEQTDKCKVETELRLVFIVKSAPENFYRRAVIRDTWGYERRFSDVEIRRIFLLGYRPNNLLQERINEEQIQYNDIMQSNFTDAYYNNTIKTMMGFKWAAMHCNSSKFYMFVDDDYYVSTKNVLRFLRNPTHYPEYVKGSLSRGRSHQRNRRQLVDFELPKDVALYAGYVFRSKPHRHYFGKFYVGLDEYPYNRWPPYVTAGAYLLSREAFLQMYYASFYTKNFRFDDIYIGLLAHRTNIEPFHSDEFYFYKKDYSRDDYTFTIASHGFGDPVELVTVWNEQKSAGNA